eukprot:Filipodium_phascolosomae@DN6700_c0_g1_i1.p1
MNFRYLQVTGEWKALVNERSFLPLFQGHRGVIKCYSAWREDPWAFFLLEYASLGDLGSELQRQQRLPYELTKFWAAEIVGILQVLRSQHVAHRDLKPENFVITREGHLKLIDFGTAVKID